MAICAFFLPKIQLVIQWPRRSPRFPHLDFRFKNHADAVYVPRLRLLKIINEPEHDCVVPSCNKSSTNPAMCVEKTEILPHIRHVP